MAQIMRKHWRQGLVYVVLALAAMAFLLPHVFPTAAVRAAETSGTGSAPAPSAATIEMATWQRVQQLREYLCLQNLDLGAMGCGQPQVEQVLGGLVGWYRDNQTAWEQAEASETDAARQLATLQRKVNLGPKDEAVLRQIPTLQQSLVTARERKVALLDQAKAIVSGSLSPSQAEVWKVVQTNRHLDGMLRYVPSLDPTQLKAMELAAYRRATGVSAPDEQTLLTAVQRAALTAAQNNQQTCLVAVVAGEAKVLPRPATLSASLVKR